MQGSSALEKLRAAFDINKKKKYIVKDSEGAEILTLYWQSLTYSDREKARRAQKSDDAELMGLRMMVDKLTDEYGEQLFQPGDVPQMRRFLPAKVVDEILVAFLNDKDYEDETKVKGEGEEAESEVEMSVKNAKKS